MNETVEQALMGVSLVAKLSPNSINPNAATMVKTMTGANAKYPLCTIIGIASGLKHGEDKNKPGQFWTALTGDFLGVNLETGEKFRSGKCFLPAGIQDVVEAPLSAAELHKDADGKPDPQSVSMKFGFRIYSVKATNPAGYTYAAEILLKPSENDPLTEMLAQVEAGAPVKQLEESSAPKSATSAKRK
jgi:hypothetical protein